MNEKQENDPVQKWCDEINKKEVNGDLTFKDAPINSYLRLLTESKMPESHVGRIVLKTHPCPQIDGDDITWFADHLTWIKVKDIQDCVVVRVRPAF
jgi:hypothetical protein